MKWNKLGKIFDPNDTILKDQFLGYAMGPQAMVFDDYVRVYFSIRKVDKVGKIESHIKFVDFDKSFENILNVSDHKVFGPGKLGCFDEHGIFPMNVVRSGDKILGYTNGVTRRKSVAVETGIGYAISHDQGNTFERIGDGPVLSATLQEPVLVGDPFVKIIDGLFHMWYIFGTGWIKPDLDLAADRVYKIGYATSKDGIEWHKNDGKQIIESKLNEMECQALPTVIEIKNTYHMYFCYRSSVDFRKNKNNAYRIGYACSNDLKNWTRNDELAGIDVSEEGWDSEMQCYPHVFEMDGKVYMLYNGNEFGKFGFGIAVLEK